MTKLIASAALALPLFAGVAVAEPLALTDAQMDGVSAGGSALADAIAAGFGGEVFTSAYTVADVFVTHEFSSEATTISLIDSTAIAGAESLAD